MEAKNFSNKENRLVFFAGKGPEQQPFNAKEGLKQGKENLGAAKEQAGAAWENLKDAKDSVIKSIDTSMQGAKASVSRRFDQFKNKWEGRGARLAAKGADMGHTLQVADQKLLLAAYSELSKYMVGKPLQIAEKAFTATEKAQKALTALGAKEQRIVNTGIDLGTRVAKTGKTLYKKAGGVVSEAWEQSAQ